MEKNSDVLATEWFRQVKLSGCRALTHYRRLLGAVQREECALTPDDAEGLSDLLSLVEEFMQNTECVPSVVGMTHRANEKIRGGYGR